MAYADTRIRSLETANECVRLGARQRTIAWITGLPTSFIFRSVFDEQNPAPRGRPPYAEDFIFRSSLKVQAEAGVFAGKYRLLVSEGIAPAQALITAFKHYQSVVPNGSVSFDEAFFLVSNLDGIWAASARTIELGKCRRCGCMHVVPRGAAGAIGCPFCKGHQGESGTTQSAACSSRSAPLSDHDAVCTSDPVTLEQRIRALRLGRSLALLGAHPRVVAALTDVATKDRDPSAGAARRPTRVGRPLNLWRWGEAVGTLQRAQYSLLATAYRRLLSADFEPEDAMRAAFVHVSSLPLGAATLSFDRCFELVALFDARWGVRESGFDLLACPKCDSKFIASRADRAPPHCPFCALIRTPGKYL
jgi:Flagellar transcriptional activator (FlhC)